LCMERALTNLVTNAIEASSEGQKVTICALTGNEKATITITDLGQGMDEETLEKIFVPFYTRKSTGVGLGMAIAKKIVEEHEGEIVVSSQLGMGTEIAVILPRKSSGTFQAAA
jgi:signal transduction histidine kinase